MKVLVFMALVVAVAGAGDFDRDVSMKSEFSNTNNDLKADPNIKFIKRAAISKARYGTQSSGIYTKDGSQTVGSTILNNSKVHNVYNYSEVKGPVINVNEK